MSKIKDSFVIITPVYEDSESASILFQHLFAEFGKQVYILAIDDGSIQNPVEVSIFEKIGLQATLIRLKSNIGHQKSIAVGLNYAAENLKHFENFIVMDSDGEDSPFSVKTILKELNTSNTDIVVAERRKRYESTKFKIFYLVYKLFFWAFVGKKIYFGNFIGLKLSSIKRLTSMRELWLNFAACVLNSKLRIKSCEIDRGERYAGLSRMNFISLTLHGFKALMVFAEDVLVRVGILCSIVAILSILGAFLAIFLKIIGFATPGWFSVALGILFLVFLQTAALTLMSLMLTGVIKSGGNIISYESLIEEVYYAKQATKV